MPSTRRTKPTCLVNRQDGRSLGTIFRHARADGFFIVVGTALEFGSAAIVADAFLGGELMAVMIAFAAQICAGVSAR